MQSSYLLNAWALRKIIHLYIATAGNTGTLQKTDPVELDLTSEQDIETNPKPLYEDMSNVTVFAISSCSWEQSQLR